MQRLYLVLQRLREENFKLKAKKCKFFQREVEYLGHVVSPVGVTTDLEKVRAVQEWAQPMTVTDVRSFLGLVSYYRQFAKGFAAIARPLHRLTQKGRQFRWTGECQEAFERLTYCLTSAPILAYPEQSEQFVLDTDASEFAVGAVLSQMQKGKERVIS